MLELRFAGIEMASQPRQDPFPPYGIVQDGLTGWWGRPGGKTSSEPKPGGIGEFDVPVDLPARIVTVSGVIQGSPQDRLERCERLSAIDATGSGAQLTVVEDGRVRSTRARVLEVDVDRRHLETVPTFDVMFKCPDPRKYGQERETRSTGSWVAANHWGTFSATGRVRVTGFVGGYRIVGPDSRRFTVNGPKFYADVDEIDLGSGMVRRNGVPLFGRVATAHVWAVPSGTDGWWRIEPIGTGTGTAVMFLRDTYI